MFRLRVVRLADRAVLVDQEVLYSDVMDGLRRLASRYPDQAAFDVRLTCPAREELAADVFRRMAG
jgi:hypothetical protein